MRAGCSCERQRPELMERSVIQTATAEVAAAVVSKLAEVSQDVWQQLIQGNREPDDQSRGRGGTGATGRGR
jgi:hypothetical protein